MSPRRARIAVGAALAVPILVLGLRFAGGSRSLYGTDFQTYFRSHGQFIRDSWRHDGELPRWNPYQYAGAPFLGNGNGNLYYPGNWLFLILSPEAAFELLALVHLFIAAIGMYRLTRVLRLDRPASTLAAMAYSMSFALIARIHAGHLSFLITACLAPLVLYLLLKVADRPTLLHSAALAGAIGLVLTGGTPQFTYHLMFLGVALVAWRIMTNGADRSGRIRAVAAIAGSGLLGLALAAVQLLPFIDVAAWSGRGSLDRASLSHLADQYHDFGWKHFRTLWVPVFPWTVHADVWLPHEKALYLGILPLFLALFRLSAGRPRGAVLVFALAAGVSLLDALGTPVLSLVPGYSMFRIPERVVWITVLCLAVLSGFGWETAGQPSPRRNLVLIGLGGLAVLGAVVLVLSCRARRESVLMLGIAAASLAVLVLRPRWDKAAFLAIALTAVDLTGYGLVRLEVLPRDKYEAPPWYARHIGPERRDFRVLDLTRIEAEPVAHGFRLLRGYGHPVPFRQSAYYASGWKAAQPSMESLPIVTGPADPQVLRRLNVRWVVTRDGAPGPEWKLVARSEGDTTLYEDPAPGPAAFLEGTDGVVQMTRPTASSIEVRVRCSGPGRLVVSEAWAKGWQARREALSIPVRAAVGEILEVDVPAGESTVTFVYSPAAWTAGRIVSGVALFLLGGLVGFGCYRSPRRDSNSSAARRASASSFQ